MDLIQAWGYKMSNLNKLQLIAIQNAIKLDGLSSNDKSVLTDMISPKNVKNQKMTLYVDGAADLHSKTAGIGGVVYLNEEEISYFSEPLYDKTNNEAEYLAMIKGIDMLVELKAINVNIFADSELVVKQVLGQYKVKNERMKNLCKQVVTGLKNIKNWSVSHVRRENNVRADELSKIGMEKARSEK